MVTIKKRILKILGVYIFITGFFSCVSTGKSNQVPLWVLQTKKLYPDANFLVAQGNSTTKNGAESEAVALLSKTLKQQVQVNTEASESLKQDEIQIKRGFNTNVKTSSLLDEITGIQIKEYWQKNETEWYALAVIDRKEVGNYYFDTIKKNELVINQYILESQKNIARFEGISALQKAYSLAIATQKYTDLLAVINPTQYKNLSLAYKNAETVNALLRAQTQKISINILITEQANRKIINAFQNIYTSQGFKIKPIHAISEANAPYLLEINFSALEAEKTDNVPHVFVYFILETTLTEVDTNKIILTWNNSGREAHFTHKEALRRAISIVEKAISEDYSVKLADLKDGIN